MKKLLHLVHHSIIWHFSIINTLLHSVRSLGSGNIETFQSKLMCFISYLSSIELFKICKSSCSSQSDCYTKSAFQPGTIIFPQFSILILNIISLPLWDFIHFYGKSIPKAFSYSTLDREIYHPVLYLNNHIWSE